MNIEGIDIKDIEFGEPIEEREPNYRDGYIRGIYRAKNIIDSKQKEIERLKKREQECIDHYLVQCKYASEMEDKYITANHIIKELAFIFDDYNEFNKILEKYNYELKGSESN